MMILRQQMHRIDAEYDRHQRLIATSIDFIFIPETRGYHIDGVQTSKTLQDAND